jgi:hypothetical protein
MITKDMDAKITPYTKPRESEEEGRQIYIELIGGHKVFGELIEHKPNIFIVRDFKDHNIIKELHRATIVRFMIVLNGGKKDDKSGWRKGGS